MNSVSTRAHGGGLRIGEMERDTLLAQGVSNTLRDRLIEQSDRYKCWVCKVCGLFATYDPETKIKECLVCETEGDEFIKQIELPYATKLVIQELIGINIVPRVLVDPDSGVVKITVR